MGQRRHLEEIFRTIGINSVSSRGNEELVNYLAFLVQSRGFKVNIQHVIHSIEDVSRRQFNLIGTMGDSLVDRKIRKGLLLLTHLDTADTGRNENWTETEGDPFQSVQKDHRIYGLGASHAKVDFLCKLLAAQKFRDQKLKMPIYVVGTCGEEIGMFGCRFLMQSLALNPKYVAVGAPTDLKVVNEHSSSSVFQISMEYNVVERGARGFNRRVNLRCLGKSAHCAVSDQGRNALQGLVDFLRLAFDNGFELQFTKIEGGRSVNQVPDEASAEIYLTSHQLEDFKRFFKESTRQYGREQEFEMELGGVGDVGISFMPEAVFPCLTEVLNFPKTLSDQIPDQKGALNASVGLLKQKRSSTEIEFEVRLVPGHSPKELLKGVQLGVSKLASRYPSLNVNSSRIRLSPALEAQNDSEWVRLCGQAMEEAGLMPNVDQFPAATEAGHFFHKGYEAVCFGPGSLESNVHGPNEFVDWNQAQQAIAFYEKLIEKSCL